MNLNTIIKTCHIYVTCNELHFVQLFNFDISLLTLFAETMQFSSKNNIINCNY
jgi:hypothetical protein